MLNMRSLLILIIVAAALGFAAFWPGAQDNSSESVSEEVGLMFASLEDQINDVTRIEVQTSVDTFSVEKHDKSWVIPSKDNHPAAVDEIGKFLIGMARLKKVEAKTSKPENFAQLEVNAPTETDSKATQINVFTDSDKPIVSLIAGKNRIAQSDSNAREFYLRKQDDNQVWLAQADWQIKKTINDWLDTSVIDLSASDLAKVVINHKEGDPVEISKVDKESTEYELANIPDDQKIRYQFALNDIAGAFSGLTFDDVKRQEGLDFESASGVVSLFDGLQVSFEVAEVEEDKWFKFLAAAGDDVSEDNRESVSKQVGELNQRWGNWAYKLPAIKQDNILKPMVELIENKEGSQEDSN